MKLTKKQKSLGIMFGDETEYKFIGASEIKEFSKDKQLTTK